MDERLFARLAARLAEAPVVLASVLETRGATPRKAGARMLVGVDDCEFSVGGGAAEAKVLAAARALLCSGGTAGDVAIDLRGGPASEGVCGGRMRVALRVWSGAADRRRAEALAATLAAGEVARLPAEAIGGGEPALLQPNARLLIVGAGHCGHALYQLARFLDFDLCVYDPRPSAVVDDAYPGAHCLAGPPTQLRQAFDTQRPVYAVLLSRDFHDDIAALEILAESPPAFLGMMGSQRRIAEVRAALSPLAAAMTIHAPVGLSLGEETPHEIAVAILAQLIQRRRGRQPVGCADEGSASL